MTPVACNRCGKRFDADKDPGSRVPTGQDEQPFEWICRDCRHDYGIEERLNA